MRRHQTVPTGWSAVDAALQASDGTEWGVPGVPSHGEKGAEAAASGLKEASQVGGLVRGALHEWFGVAPAGECWSPPLFLLTHLARQASIDAHHRGAPDHVVWIGQNVWPYPRALSHPVGVELVGEARYQPRLEASITLFDPAAGSATGSTAGEPIIGHNLLSRSLFVATNARSGGQPNGRPYRQSSRQASERLWAIDTALRCPGVTVVVADGSGLPMAATRRLQLAAASTGALVLLARPPEEVREISAATTRWIVTREAAPEENAAPEGPCWRLALIRAKGTQKVITVLPAPLHHNRGVQQDVGEDMGRRRNQPSIHRYVHSHAARPSTPPAFIFDRPVPAPAPTRDAPTRRPEDVVPPLDTNERWARLHRGTLQ